MALGFLYIVSHKSYPKNTYKLGCTKFDENKIITRYNTGHVESVNVLEMFKVSDYKLAEKLLFHRLKNCRVYPNREFFCCDLSIIKENCTSVRNYINTQDDIIPEPVPETVIQQIRKNIEHIDIYASFLDEKTEISKSNVHTYELYTIFKQWFKNKYHNKNLPNIRIFLKGIRKYQKIVKSVRIDDKVSTGIKNLKIIYDE